MVTFCSGHSPDQVSGKNRGRTMCIVHLLKKYCLIGPAAVILGILAPATTAQPLVLTIVHVNDWDRMEGRNDAGGAARIATVVAEERARARAHGGHAVVTFGGDMISPSLMSGIDKGAHMIALANAIGFDIGTLGNHEFDFGVGVLRKRLMESRMTWLAGNVRYRGQTGLPETPATLIVEKGGYRIGFLGLVTTDTARISSPGPDVTFAPFTASGVALARKLKVAGADLVIALTHDNISRDLSLLEKAREIDILLGGHDHLLLARYDGRQAVMKAGSQGNHVAVLDLRIERRENRVFWTPGYNLRSTEGLPGDESVAAMVATHKRQLDRNLGAVIGESATPLVTTRNAVRSGETAFGNLVADAMRAATGSDIALTNGGGIRGDTVHPGGTKLTRKLILAELPFGDKTVKLRLTGDQVRRALENGVSQVAHLSGRFPQVSGLSFTFDSRKPAGSRITRITIDGKRLDPRATYTLATVDFLANGGDGYTMFRSGEALIDSRSGGLTATQLIDLIAAVGIVSPKIEGRIVREP